MPHLRWCLVAGVIAALAVCPAGAALADALTTSPAAAERKPAVSSVTVSGVSEARAALIAEHAEQVRRSAFDLLLGDAEPRPWVPRCAIHIHATPAAFTAAVGGPPAASRGATSLEFSGDRVASRRIDVMGDGPGAIPDALAHELVHVVLADRFTEAAPPRWADEGIALLFDDVAKQAGHEADFRSAHARGLAYAAGDLLALEEYPGDVRRQRVFYGQSAALVRWLVDRRDPATFIRFVADLQAGDPGTAFERHYDLDMAAVFDSAWKEVRPIHSLSFNSTEN
ncbi:MAG: hypothetical protein ACKOB1_13170 [Planctomycetia bacterium]